MLQSLLLYEKRQEVKENYFATLLWSIASGLLNGFEMPPYQSFLQQIDGKDDRRSGAEILHDVKSHLMQRIRERKGKN